MANIGNANIGKANIAAIHFFPPVSPPFPKRRQGHGHL